MAIQLDGLTGITSSGNVTAPYFYGNGAFLTGIAGGGSNVNFANVANSIIPAANAIYSLGNATNQWGNIWVSNTVYLNNVPLTTSANTLFVNGLPVLTSANAYGNANVELLLETGISNNIVTSGNITGNVVSNLISSTTTVMVLDPGADGSPLTGNVRVLGNLEVTGNVTYTNIDSSTTANLLWIAASNANTPLSASGGGLAVGNANAPYATFTYNSLANTWNTNLPLVVNGNVTGDYFIGNGRYLTGMYGNTDVSSYLDSGTNTANITTTGNINGTYYYGNGAYLTGIPAGYTNADVAAYLASGNLTSNIITTANVIAGNVNSTGNINATGNIGANNVVANNFIYANGTPVVFNQPVSVTSNIAFVDNLAPILVASDYSNPTYPGGLFTLYQPAGAVLISAASWASGGSSKNAYANYAGNVVNTQNMVLNLTLFNGTFNVQSTDTITIGTSTITGANITGLGIAGVGGNYTISSALFNSNVQIDSSTAVSARLTTNRGAITTAAGNVTTVAPTPFAVGNLIATWTNATVILGSATQQFTWIASNVTGSVLTGNVNLTGAFTQSLSTSNALSGASTPIVSDTGPYVVTASYTGTGLNGAGNNISNVSYTLTPATDIAPLYYKITANDSDPNFTTADSHYTIPFTVPNVALGQPMPVGAQGMNTSNVSTNYNWLALPGGANTYVWGNSVPATGNVNIFAAFDQGAFYQIIEGEPTPANLGQSYYTSIAGVPYTVVGWYGWTSSQFLYLAKIV